MVDVVPFTPLFLEGLLALAHSQGIVEIPRAVVGRAVAGCGCGVLPCAGSRVFRDCLLCRLYCGCVPHLLLFLLQGFYHSVYRCVPLVLRHGGKRLQGVLEMYGIGERHEQVELLRPVVELLVVLAVVVE